jgi:hypothetical protein
MTTTAGTSSYASLPYPGDVQVPDVPADLKTLIDRLDTIFTNVFGGSAATPMPSAPITPGILTAAASQGTFQTQLNTQGTNITTLQGQVATLQSQVATLQSQIAVLQRTPIAYSKIYPSYVTIPGGAAGATPKVLNTVTVASQTYRQLLLIQAQSTWDLAYDTNHGPLLQQVLVNGQQRSASFQQGFELTMNDTYMMTIEAGATATIVQQISAPETFESQSNQFWQSYYEEPHLYVLALPWTGGVVGEVWP